ncbi:Junctophilin-3 [Fasciola hepatica]|uniref:Junctophilin-3 n=1 Tax=Fasciola hepatica TaxID=6192 RepID=A0A4E0RPZ4_FASHE|nr:Junctophilin-3 [Fasciola hepatica]
MEGGRFDFSDGGSYVGEWCEGRAHGLGIATGPENQGEYSGEWNMGFESRGVYIWPSGNIYCGTWLKGKRHGEGVQIKGRWIYRGAFTTGFCGRYGVKESLTSCAKYEGSWHLNKFDGFGVETNSDGSIYAGAWSKGMRQGLGVRRSAPYALASEFNRAVRAAQSQNSIPSGTDSERGWRGTGSVGGGSTTGGAGQAGGAGTDFRMTGERGGRADERRSGFVLRSTSCPSPASQANVSRSSSSGYRSATPGGEKKSIFKRGLFRKLRKQKSTGDLSMLGGHTMGGFSSSSGCGGGTLFQSRGRRTGGSLRSTLSGSSQLTTNSFGRGELKGLGNGVQGLHETMEEPLGPNVTETYSGQWNEDRRSGYGVAERSDGLCYAGEWFNNKKDGFGVTYFTDGTKEEGRYKENILVQVLNRKSKLFLLRHTKLRDAIEEAVKNAQDAAKSAKESSSENAYQRAQTARTVANTADERARMARKLSDEARAVAREFSPEFIQLGLRWERQNPLVKKELFGLSSTKESNEQSSPVRQMGQQSVLQNTMSNEMQGRSLEVSGGSRQGSFRSSFRRHGPRERMPTGPDQYDANIMGQDQHQRPVMGCSVDDSTYSKGSLNTGHDLYGQPSRSPAGRPIARAATTGVTGIDFAHADQRQMAQHMAQHPHSPYIMASTSQHLDEFIDPVNEVGYSSVQRTRTGQRGPTTVPQQVELQRGRVTMGSAQLAMGTREHRAAEIRLAHAELVSPSETHQAAVGLIEIRESMQGNDGSRSQSPTSVTANEVYRSKTHTAEPVKPPVEVSPEISVTHVRRRTLPSIITEPPRGKPEAIQSKWQKKQSPSTRRAVADRLRKGMTNVSGRIDEDAVHSADNLPADAAATYIIENGIRKRVQAVTQQQQQQLLRNPYTGHDSRVDERRRPEWTTAYDPYRPAMDSTMVVARTESLGVEPASEQAELQPLPRAYRIDSEISLLGAVKESSMPDLPSACNHESPRSRNAHGRHMGLTRAEIDRLTQVRRRELTEELERRRRGEIVIRLADIKDWIRNNFVLVFVLLINASLALFFFNLLTGVSDQSGSVGGGTLSSHLRSRSAPPPGTAGGTVQLAKKVLSDAIKKTRSSATGATGMIGKRGH